MALGEAIETYRQNHPNQTATNTTVIYTDPNQTSSSDTSSTDTSSTDSTVIYGTGAVVVPVNNGNNAVVNPHKVNTGTINTNINATGNNVGNTVEGRHFQRPGEGHRGAGAERRR
jgi:hypothetical protein